MSTQGVLLMDGELHFASAVLESLGRHGTPVTVAAEHSGALTRYSRYCSAFLVYPSAKESLPLFIQALGRYLAKNRFSAIFPLSDLTLWPISKHRELFGKNAILPLPAHQSVERVLDKKMTVELAQDCDIPVPETYHAESVEGVKHISGRVRYPAVVKPRFSWSWKNGRTTTQAGLRPDYAHSAAELMERYSRMHEKSPFPIVQEYVPGQNYSVAVLCDNGKVRASCCIRVARAMPTMGGNSTLRETVKPDPRMIKYADQLMGLLGWHGIAEVEFRLDRRDLRPKLMEINGRFWGSLQVAIAAGVDFPYLLYKLVTEGTTPAATSYRVGVKSRWLGADLRHLMSVLKGNCFTQESIPQPKLQAIHEFLAFSNESFDEIHLNDISPFLMSLGRLNLLRSTG